MANLGLVLGQVFEAGVLDVAKFETIILHVNRGITKVDTTQPNTTISIPDLVADAVLEEIHTDQMEITTHPIQEGTVISDHAYKQPTELVLTYVWSGGGSGGSFSVPRGPDFLVNMYKKLKDMYEARIPLRVITGKATYDNMLISGISITTDASTENALIARISLQELLMVTVDTTSMATDPAAQTMPEKTNPVTNKGVVDVSPGTFYNPSCPTVQKP
jgi:hypothetical protein